MDDLTITKLCAEAMGWKLEEFSRGFRCRDEDNYIVCIIGKSSVPENYDPLHDDAQAMALVKQFPIQCIGAMWEAVKSHNPTTQRFDLNRAICECVAKVQQAKGDK